MDFLHLVLHVPEQGPPSGPEIQRVLLHAAVYRHGHRLPTGGWIGDSLTKRYGRRVGRNYLALASLLLAAAFIAFGTQVASPRLASLVLAGGAGAVYLSLSSFWAVTADIAGTSAGTASGLVNMGSQLGGALTASLTPWIADHFGWTPSFLVAAALCVLAALAWLFVDPDKPIGVPAAAPR